MSRKIKRAKVNAEPGPDALEGYYYPGLRDVDIAAALGTIIAKWVHLEDMMVAIFGDLTGGRKAPARQIFKTLPSNAARINVMRACLTGGKINARKGAHYDQIIADFETINSLRNSYVHGLWYTHESGATFLSRRSIDDDHYLKSEVVVVSELSAMDALIDDLTISIQGRRSPKLTAAITGARKNARRNG